uniref:procollagen-proline 4-dioxygenase n=1 Tax=Tetradesmus obliquus TaxID=3088 RepID=A0A383VHQ9_TETOB|eukprot:jgi/Sobl393_1/12430/SZX65057.1
MGGSALCGVLLLALLLHSNLLLSNAESIGYGEVQETWRGEIEQLSWKPRAFLIKGFLSDEECDHIIRMASPKMEESVVVDSASGTTKKSTVRTSTGTFFPRGHDDVITVIEKRVAAVTMIPVEHQEGLQVLHYRDGQKYEAHYDYFHDPVNTRMEAGGQRVVTVLMYLTTPEHGGETVFPDAEKKVEGPGWSECALKGLANKPKRGDALMFYSLTPDGKKDPTSLHGSCPTLKGDKWSATKWIHVAPYGVPQKPTSPGEVDCIDDDSNCPSWAHHGECDKNPAFMHASCKKSCKVCGDPAKTNTGVVIDVPVKTA